MNCAKCGLKLHWWQKKHYWGENMIYRLVGAPMGARLYHEKCCPDPKCKEERG